MKNFIIICVVSLVLILVGCERYRPPVEVETSEQDGGPTFLGKKPVKVNASIEELSIDGVTYILDDEVLYPDPGDLSSHPLIDLSDGAEIYYRVTSTEDISFVRLDLWYDTNCNSDLYVHEDGDDYKIEAWSQIFQNPYADATVAWDGDVTALGLDAIVYNYNPYFLFDELATYDYQTGAALPNYNNDDHYLLRLDVYADGPTRVASKKFYLWLTGAEDRSAIRYFVKDITLNYTVNKNKATPVTTIQIDKIENDVVAPAGNVFVQGTWSGFLKDSFEYNIGGPSDGNGVITIIGPTFKTNLSGTLSFSVSTIRAQVGVYDPWENTCGNVGWIWPGVKPIMEILF